MLINRLEEVRKEIKEAYVSLENSHRRAYQDLIVINHTDYYNTDKEIEDYDATILSIEATHKLLESLLDEEQDLLVEIDAEEESFQRIYEGV
jgi:TRAP-type mannitol/chloroaromatic compound transport system substrate-binding protein